MAGIEVVSSGPGATLSVYAGATASGTVVHNGGSVNLGSGYPITTHSLTVPTGTVTGTVINSGGQLKMMGELRPDSGRWWRSSVRRRHEFPRSRRLRGNDGYT